ncbi:MAG: hypothetical protein O3C21_11515 [Verrucomicrobia bacterium]|nr:hypothetical protein [Verrucomicrobiota bacterium]
MTELTHDDVIRLVRQAKKQQIRAGNSFSFMDISIMVVGDRLFCRRYHFDEPSWHTAFLANPSGQIKADDTVIPIDAVVPHDLGTINFALNEAYQTRFGNKVPERVLQKAIDQKSMASTLELIPRDLK